MMRSGLWISPPAFIEIKAEMLTICLVFHLIGCDSMDMDLMELPGFERFAPLMLMLLPSV